MDDKTIGIIKELSILKHSMNDEVFMNLWGKMYPEHCYGGYHNEQLAIWNKNPFAFVVKWPDFIVQASCVIKSV